MAKWADYLISAKRCDVLGAHIQKLQVHVDKGDVIGSPSVWLRSQVVDAIEDTSKTFFTITWTDDDEWKKGEKVHIVTVDGVKYLRTDANETDEDNLDELPEF
jgi:hypothetical protein